MHAKTLCPVTVGRLNSLQGGGSGSMDQFPVNFKVRLHWLVMARKREHFCTEMALVLLILSIAIVHLLYQISLSRFISYGGASYLGLRLCK